MVEQGNVAVRVTARSHDIIMTLYLEIGIVQVSKAHMQSRLVNVEG